MMLCFLNVQGHEVFGNWWLQRNRAQSNGIGPCEAGSGIQSSHSSIPLGCDHAGTIVDTSTGTLRGWASDFHTKLGAM